MKNIIALFKKEIIHIKQDNRTLGIVLIMPIVLLILFGCALRLEIKNISLLVSDLDKTNVSRDLVKKLQVSQYFKVTYTDNPSILQKQLDTGRYKSFLIIPHNFKQNLAKKQNTDLQYFIDGSIPTVTNSALGAFKMIINNYSASYFNLNTKPIINIKSRILYNPALKDEIYFIPALIGLLITQITLILTSIAIVREKETKTIEQLIVTPIKKSEILIGKILPYLLISFVDVLLICFIGVTVFNVPIKGSIILLLICSLVYIFACLSIGLFISTIAKTQIHAVFSSIFVFLPSFMLSGFMFPIEGMPGFIQPISKIIPLTYFNNILRGIFTKGIGLKYLYPDLIFLLLFGLAMLTLGITRFKKQLE
ncbi:ABC transporter permease [bacterium]|jgi:ABC-2 type transport system permease protein|nr:ABC transporter permease [bacterium]MBT4551419.1 ABC transporter permease [bacterium]